MFIYENKGMRGSHTADQPLCFSYIDSTIPLLSKSEISSLAIFCGSAERFVSNLVGNPEDRFSHDVTHIIDSSFAVSTILSGDSRESVVEKIHNHLIEVGEQVRDNKIPMEDYLITKVLY